jgi:uncharacterized protein (TIGR02145 family)
MANNGVSLTISNPDNKPVVYAGAKATSLTFALTNQTGTNVTLQSGATPSTIELFLNPPFVLDDIQNMAINLTGWTASVNKDDLSLMLVYTGGGTTNWNDGTVFNIPVTGVQTNAQPGLFTEQVNFTNFPTAIPAQVTAPLSVSTAPTPGNGDLTKILQVTLDNQGGVIVSPTNDPLQNTLFLNIKNIGETPLYNGTNMWQGSPTVNVSFVYGTGTGCLAPDDKANSGIGSGSAWNINAAIPYFPPQNIWHTSNPDKGISNAPVWVLNPTKLNQGIIGTGENANITFSFDTIISFTPPGHTQMIVQFTGFMKDDKTPYDDAVFVLDIVKVNAPPTRGLTNFFSINPIYLVNEPTTAIDIPVRWAMFDVASVTLITNFPGINPVNIPYPNPQTIAYGNAVVTIPGTTQSTAVTITLQAYDGTGGFLNSMQFTVFIQANMFVDPRDGKVYPVVKINSRLWMSINLDYSAPSGTTIYGPEAQYGLLYDWAAASPQQSLNGWRLPNKADWMDLVNNFSYAQLTPGTGGTTGFNALLNGSADCGGNLNGFSTYGTYWTSVNNNGNVDYVSFSSQSNTVTYLGGVNAQADCNSASVRLVRDIS